MRQVSNPSELLLSQDHDGMSGVAIFRAVERGMEIPENLDELVFPEDVKELEDKAENQEAEISQSHSAETTVSADELSGEKETVSSEAEPANKNQESVRMETEPAEEGVQGEQKKEDSPASRIFRLFTCFGILALRQQHSTLNRHECRRHHKIGACEF